MYDDVEKKRSRYSAALKTANKPAVLAPHDADPLRTQQQLEEKLGETLLKELAGAFVGGFLSGGVMGFVWALNDWSKNGPPVCTVPATYPAYPWQCLLFGHPVFPLAAYLGRIVLIGLGFAVLTLMIVCAIAGPRRWRRERILRQTGW